MDNKDNKKKRKKKDKEQKEHKKPWREVYATVEDIQNFLMDRVLLRHNVITRRVECRIPDSMPCSDPQPPRSALPLGSSKNLGGSWQTWQPISDRIVNSLWAELSATKAVRAQDLYRVIESDFVPEYNPFTFYLEHLPPWDGKDDYILELSLSVCVKGDEQTQWQFYEYLRKWLVAMVAGWVDASVVNNVILVLIGENMVHELSAIRLGRAFTELGFELKHTKTGNYYRVVQRSAQEIQSLLRCIPEDGERCRMKDGFRKSHAYRVCARYAYDFYFLSFILHLSPKRNRARLFEKSGRVFGKTRRVFIKRRMNMRAMTKHELAAREGVSVRTLMRWCRPFRAELDAMGLKPTAKKLPTRVVNFLSEKLCIDVE